MKYLRYAVALSAFCLSACSSNTVKDTLGLNRSAPDEYRVVSRPPLSIPPQFTLRPPTNADVSPNELSASQKAQSLVTGSTSSDASAPAKPAKGKAKAATTTSAESQFLKNAGTSKADPNVRSTLVEDRYVAQEKQDDSSWWDILSGPPKKDPLVDAKKESQRINKNESEGQPVTTGDTPEIKDRDTGVLGRIFGY